ncbi:MAG: hypothetical protein H7A37_02795 [Chlamydiales bacterium]|nr:hypothetical protein [Chlamydiales bacterium]
MSYARVGGHEIPGAGRNDPRREIAAPLQNEGVTIVNDSMLRVTCERCQRQFEMTFQRGVSIVRARHTCGWEGRITVPLGEFPLAQQSNRAMPNHVVTRNAIPASSQSNRGMSGHVVTGEVPLSQQQQPRGNVRPGRR